MNRALHHVIVTRDVQAWPILRSKIDESHLSQFIDSLTIETSIQRQFNERLTSTLSEHAAQSFGKLLFEISNSFYSKHFNFLRCQTFVLRKKLLHAIQLLLV